jgi:hypothetical protein
LFHLKKTIDFMKKLILAFFVVFLSVQSLAVQSACVSGNTGTCISITVFGTTDDFCGDSARGVAKDCKK